MSCSVWEGLSVILFYVWEAFKENQNPLAATLSLNTCPAEPGYALPLHSVDPDQLDSSEANWSGSALFVIKYMNLKQQPGSSNLIGWKLKVGRAS